MAQSLREIKVAKTKELLRNTFVDLLEEKGFDAISVRDITSKAGLNRGTFYLHYLDKYDLMEKNQNELLKGLHGKIKQLKPCEFDKYYSKEMIYPPIVQLFCYLMENKRFIKILISSNGDPAFPKKMKEYMKESFYEKLNVIEKQHIIDIPHQYITSFISSAFFGLIEQWLEKDEQNTPEEMALMHMKMLNFMKQLIRQNNSKL
ncbi:TetR/AcrR family transcriptional regulator [Sutcliffiella horikoshii]|uniref:TetR/AcrR family transcriptional regulator n=1 Tax=Sutcliffiella horikoshii TaxID=79883 RepID=UPI00384E43FE